MTHRLRLCIGVFLLGLSGCDYYDSRLRIINESSSAICIESYKDTIPKDHKTNHPEFYLGHQILPGDTSAQTIPGKDAWIIEIQTNRNRRLNLFIYKIDTVRKYHDMALINKKRLFKQISLTQEQLEINNWTVKISDK
ncbi:hypothetical protein [Hymenobacter glacialis]|uniref:hypothetical protein n=1 Tax=Hymenobacter glacialis TaxID=1908236 RepID=UPI000F7A77CA|nr:hypothetical protein [Hymenobacter glacialis]